MRISWLSAEEIAAARQALTADGASWNDHFGPEFSSPALPGGLDFLDWEHITEHVARAERVSEVVRDHGILAARAEYEESEFAIEAATLAAALYQGDELQFDDVVHVLRCPIDPLVFYAPFLELLVSLGRDQVDEVVRRYEEFVASYAATVSRIPHGTPRIGAVLDGLADFYVSAGRTDAANALFTRRHDEDRGDVAVALSASRAFLAAGSVSHAVRWLGEGAERAAALGRGELAQRLRSKQEAVRRRLS